MTGTLRFVGILNAAVWFGASLFFTIAVGPAIFSKEMLALFGAAQSETLARYYAGSVAQVVIERFFVLQHWCGAIGLLCLLAEWVLTGRPLQRATLLLVLALFCVGLAGGFWLQPRLHQWHRAMYGLNGPTTQTQIDQAHRSFVIWHGVSQAANGIVLIGLGVLLWRVSQPVGMTRFAARPKYSLE